MNQSDWLKRHCKFAQTMSPMGPMGPQDASGWQRFMDYGSWDNVVEAGMGDPTPEEEKAIISLGYWGQPITPETIRGLEQGTRYDANMISPSGLAIHMSLVDGDSTESFNSPEEMKQYIEERIQGAHDIRQDSFSTDFGIFNLIGATMADLGISSSMSQVPMEDSIEGPQSLGNPHGERMSRWVARNCKFALSYEPAFLKEASDSDEDVDTNQHYIQWMSSNNEVFFPASRVVKRLVPGFYDIGQTMGGETYFHKIDLNTEELIEFPETTIDEVVEEIETFWDREAKFRKAGLAFKRGILMYGPPGSGKTSAVRMILKNIVARGGIVVKFESPGAFSSGMNIVREIQKDTPVVCLMEDLDSILEWNSESKVINVIDGMEGFDKVVFLATTNYPEKLGSRIMNRPSRFDKRIFIGMPNAESRKIYLKAKLEGESPEGGIDKWVSDSENFSIAHLKELVVAVTIMDMDYEETIQRLKQMADKVDSKDWDKFGEGDAFAEGYDIGLKTVKADATRVQITKTAQVPVRGGWDEILRQLQGMGFGVSGTGGGCDALGYYSEDESYILITNEDGCGEPEEGDNVTIGLYTKAYGGDPTAITTFSPNDYHKVIPVVKRFMAELRPNQESPINAPTEDPKGRMYDLFNRGGNATPEESTELQNLINTHGRPKYMASKDWVIKNCKFGEGDVFAEKYDIGLKTVKADAGFRLEKRAKHEDKLPGGLADDKEPSDFDSKQIGKGTKVEQEHTKDKALAKEITMDHLSEDPKYYDKLDKMEKKEWVLKNCKFAQMGGRVLPNIDRERYTEIPGLEGPFRLESGKVVYYDPKEGKYYDRDSDMYMEHDEYEGHTKPRQINQAGPPTPG